MVKNRDAGEEFLAKYIDPKTGLLPPIPLHPDYERIQVMNEHLNEMEKSISMYYSSTKL